MKLGSKSTMHIKTPVNDVYDFIFSDQCKLDSPTNGAHITATRSAFEQPYVTGKVSFHSTQGAKALSGVLSSNNISDREQDMLWQVAFTRYVALAKGNVSVSVEPSRELDITFGEHTLPQLAYNRSISTINDIDRKAIDLVVKQDPNAYGQVSADIVRAVIQFERSQQYLDLPLVKVYKDAYERLETRAVAKAVKEVIGDRIIDAQMKVISARKLTEQVQFAYAAHIAEREARQFLKNTPFVAIPFYLRQMRIRKELAIANRNYSDALKNSRLVTKDAVNPEQLSQINQHVNQILSASRIPDLQRPLTTTRKQSLNEQVQKLASENQSRMQTPVVENIIKKSGGRRL